MEGIQPSISTLLTSFVEHPENLSHLLFVGPPGSGKTTTAMALVQAFHGVRKHYMGKVLFLNSSDERSLEAVRSKVYPFAKNEIASLFGEDYSKNKAPKIIIFDEAETLTEQAQSALRPLLDKKPSDLLILFLCNSISRIHHSILHRFLRICFESASTDQFRNRFGKIYQMTHPGQSPEQIEKRLSMITDIDIQYRRGDIRFFLLQSHRLDETARLWLGILNMHPNELFSTLQKFCKDTTLLDLITQIFSLFQSIPNLLNQSDIEDLMNLADSDILRIENPEQTLRTCVSWILRQKVKLESCLFSSSSVTSKNGS
jgi:adenylate kinase family enzyme